MDVNALHTVVPVAFARDLWHTFVPPRSRPSSRRSVMSQNRESGPAPSDDDNKGNRSPGSERERKHSAPSHGAPHRAFKAGDKVRVKIVTLGPDGALVDLWGKERGVLDLRELRTPEAPEPKVGDT